MTSKYERTARDYPTFGPADGTGRDWNEYFRDVKGRIDPADDEPADDDDGDLPEPVTITVPGHEVSEGWPRSIGTWRTRCLASGWQVKVGHAVAHHDDSYYKNGNLKKLAHDVGCWWIDALKDGVYISITYYIRDGQPYGGWTSRIVRHEWYRKYSDKQMQALIKGELDDTSTE